MLNNACKIECCKRAAPRVGGIRATLDARDGSHLINRGRSISTASMIINASGNHVARVRGIGASTNALRFSKSDAWRVTKSFSTRNMWQWAVGKSMMSLEQAECMEQVVGIEQQWVAVPTLTLKTTSVALPIFTVESISTFIWVLAIETVQDIWRIWSPLLIQSLPSLLYK